MDLTSPIYLKRKGTQKKFIVKTCKSWGIKFNTKTDSYKCFKPYASVEFGLREKHFDDSDDSDYFDSSDSDSDSE